MIEYLKPNLAEGIALIIATVILLVGIRVIWRAHAWRRSRPARQSPGHLRHMAIRRQKDYESLPPGQL